MKLFKKNENKKTDEAADVWQGQKGLPLLLYGSNGAEHLLWEHP